MLTALIIVSSKLAFKSGERVGVNHQLSAISYQLSAISYLPSAISYLPSAISYLPSAISYLPSAISYLPSAIRHQPPPSPFRFESLAIWRSAREFSKMIHDLTTQFPRSEMFGLRSQMTRAADAVSLLIAEGAGLHTNTLFYHRLSLAVAELFEVVAGAFLAQDRNYLTETQHREIYQRAQRLAREINAFRRTLIADG